MTASTRSDAAPLLGDCRAPTRSPARRRMEPHARCNLACAHCYIAAGSWHRARGELTTAEVLRITDEILALNAAPLFILSGGEPLLREDLEDIAAHATRGGATVVVGTNGTRLTDDASHRCATRA
jgi:MoaA/NifB/PqqE/SkfB family radical SAM enzyme